MKNIQPESLFSRAYVRDDHAVYDTHAMLIAVLAHTHGHDRDGIDGDTVRKMLDDINLER